MYGAEERRERTRAINKQYANPNFSYSRSQEGLNSPRHDGGDGLERRPPAGTARRRRAAGRTPRSEVAPSRRESQRSAGSVLGVADTVVTVRAMCLRCVKADGKEPPAALGVVPSSPTGKNPRRRRLYAISSVGGRCRDGSHPGDSGLRRRGPAGCCAGRRPAFQAVPAVAPSALRARGLIRAVGVRLRLLSRQVGVPYPTPRHGDQRLQIWVSPDIRPAGTAATATRLPQPHGRPVSVTQDPACACRVAQRR